MRYGFIFEGVLRQHMIAKGRNRDTAYFSMLDSEWPARKAAFEINKLSKRLHRQVGQAILTSQLAVFHFQFGRQATNFAAQGFVRLALGERAEAAFIAADIGVVDVAVDGVGDDIAVDLGA